MQRQLWKTRNFKLIRKNVLNLQSKLIYIKKKHFLDNLLLDGQS